MVWQSCADHQLSNDTLLAGVFAPEQDQNVWVSIEIKFDWLVLTCSRYICAVR